MIRAAGCGLDGRSGHEAGRELLRRLYWEETGQALPEIRKGIWGKPYFADSSLKFSVTHTNRHAFCVLADCEVGIDAEELDRPVLLRAARRILSAGEMRQMEASADPRRAFLTFWVLKEAEAKLTGQGIRAFPNKTNFQLTDPRVREWDGCLVAIAAAGSTEGVKTDAF